MATSAKGATSIAGTSAGKALASALSTYGTTNIKGTATPAAISSASTSAPTASSNNNLRAGFYKDTTGTVREYSPGFTNPSYFQGATYLGASEKLAPAPKTPTIVNADDAIKDYTQKVADVNALSNQIAQQQAAQGKATSTTAPKMTSVVDYLASQGQANDFASRATLAKQSGIQGYTGTAQQNMQLLNILQNQPKKDNTAALVEAAKNSKYQPITPATTTPTTTPTTPATPATPVAQPTQKSEAMQQYEKTGNDYLNQLDATYENMKSDLDKVRNGTFPLSASDQTILDQTQKAIDRQKQMQIDANDTYQKAIEVAGVSSGRARYAPELQAGNLANAVNSGIQKIADIESEGALTLAKLNQSIEEKNYAMVKDYYASLQSVLKEKTNTLMAMQQATMANEKDLRDYNYKVAQDAIQNIYQNKQLDWQMKNAEANRVLENQKFDWQKTMDLKNYNLAVQKASVDNNLNELLSVTEAKALGVPYGTTKGQAIQAGKVPGAGEASQSVRNIVSNLDELMSKYKTLDWRSKGIVGGSIGEQIQSQKFNPADQAFETQRNLMGMELARLFEKGRMSDQDRAFYLALMPSRSMESASAEASAKELKRLLSYQLVSGKPPSLASNEIESLDNSKPPGNYLVMDYSTGNLGYIPTNEYDPSKYLNFSD